MKIIDFETRSWAAILLVMSLLFGFSLVLTGCSNSETGLTNEGASPGESVLSSDESELDDSAGASVKRMVDESYIGNENGFPFENGFSWMPYNEPDGSDHTMYARVDSRGYAGYIVDSVIEGRNYELGKPDDSGYTYFIEALTEDEEDESSGAYGVWVVDENGETSGFYPYEGDGTGIVCYGGGYVVKQTHVSNYNEEYFAFELINADGEVVYDFVDENQKMHEMAYCGRGVFWFGGEYIPDLYFCAEPGVAVEMESNFRVRFFEDRAAFAYEFNKDEEVITITLLTASTGEVTSFDIPLLSSQNNTLRAIVKDDVCLIHEPTYDHIAAYNLSTGELSILDDSYDLNMAKDARIVPSNGRIVLPLRGADNEPYFGIFDTELNLVGEPVLLTESNSPVSSPGAPHRMPTTTNPLYGEETFACFNSDRLVVGNQVFNTEGSLLFDVTKYGQYYNLAPYSEGVTSAIWISSGEEPVLFLDENGDVLFSEIDVSSATELEPVS